MSFSRRALLRSSAAMATSALFITGCKEKNPKVSEALPAKVADNAAIEAQTLLEQVTDFMLKSYPETASSSGIDTGKYAGLKSQLSDRSIAGQDKIGATTKMLRAQLRGIDRSALSADQTLNIDVVTSVFETAQDGFKFPFGDMALLNSNWSYRNAPYVVAQNIGAFVEIPSFLDSSHHIENGEDASAYIARLKAYAEQLDGETERVTRDGARGVILPDFLMKKTIGQLQDARKKSPEDWGLITSFEAKTQNVEQASGLLEEARKIAHDKIGPAIDRQIAALEALAPQATSKAGIWGRPDGEEYYHWALRASTTTSMSPAEVHQMGLDELAALHSRMEPILKSIGYTKGSVGERMTALGKDPKYLFKEGDPGRAEIMDFIHDALKEIRALMPQAFETQVPGFLEVTRIDPEVEAGAPGAYGGAGSIDGKKPGHFWINLRSTDLHNKFNLKDLTYHEAIPGHVWQGEYTFKQPLVRSMLGFNAYSEGWALYAQQIADELGVYDDFPVGRLGYLQSLAFRACRLVVDTGLHAKRWTREEANQWFVANNGSNPEEVRGEVDRYCAWPGQACGYKVGHSAINRLRDKAKSELGPKFNFRRFNDAVVLGGSVPMTVLEHVIDNYIAGET